MRGGEGFEGFVCFWIWILDLVGKGVDWNYLCCLLAFFGFFWGAGGLIYKILDSYTMSCAK